MGLPYGEEIMIVGRTMWTQSMSVTDRRTDRITITKTAQRIASRGKTALSTHYTALFVLHKIHCITLHYVMVETRHKPRLVWILLGYVCAYCR